MNNSDHRFLKAANGARQIAAAVATAPKEFQDALADRALRDLRDAYSLPVGAGANRLTYHERFRRVVAVLAVDGLIPRGEKPVSARSYVRQHILQIGGAIKGDDLLRWRKWLRASDDPTSLHLFDRLREIYSTDTRLFAIAILIAFAPAFEMLPIKSTH
ncbi:hypothetical protein B0E45_26180 [Sinorhizobium sp. A49]|uniref:hypothetical protein n=1 Tax=Sinorhizobium sp. A49 TaxID=1945861 RepID=UPI000987D445|nr:hypothetical protein [Sinorhizobium sp. A49]OOG66729.1 hypothetical protein B0E45_26180 [Sinorhizobium sp. A49]